MEFLFKKLHAYQLQPSVLRVFKIPENSSSMLWGPSSLQNTCPTQLFEKLPGRLSSEIVKDSTIDVLMRSLILKCGKRMYGDRKKIIDD